MPWIHNASTRAWRTCTSSVLVSSALTLAACGSSGGTPADNHAPQLPVTAQPTAAAGAGAAPATAAATPTAAGTTPASQAPSTLPAANSGAAGNAAPSTGTPASATPASAGTTPAMAGASTPASTAATVTPATSTTMPPTAAEGTGGQIMLAMDECGLHTNYPGDNYCIKPPPPDKGFQIHLGPSNYDNPEPQWIMQPGNEDVENFTATSGNTTDVYYYWRQYRMRPGTHHMILTSGGFDGHRIGGAQNLAYDNPEGGIIPDENKDVGMKLAANTPLNINLHYINFTDKPILKEVWINVWYRDPADVKEAANEMYSFAPMDVPPGEHVVIRGVCPVQGDGRILTMYGHRHANNVRFSMWHEHGSMKDLVYEDYNWEDPLILEFSSVEKNMPPDPMNKIPGGWSGILNVADGDNISFECEIINMSNKTFFGANEAKDDEMCIMVGDTVKTNVSNLCQYTTTQVTASGQ